MVNGGQDRGEQSKLEELITRAVKDDRSSPRGLLITLIVLMVIIILMAFLLFMGEGGRQKAFKTSKLNQMQEMVGRIQALEGEMNRKRREIFSIIREYREKTGRDLPGGNLLNLSEEERKVLEEKIRREEDVSIKSLIGDILQGGREIQILRQRITKIEELLPKATLVRPGENHYQLAMDYLLNYKGLEKSRARELIERTMLYDTLLPGFKVWNFYSGEEFGTFITQGAARVSPNTLRRQATAKLINARERALQEKTVLTREIEDLKKARNRILEEMQLLTAEKADLVEKLNELSEKEQQFQKQINSLYYVAGTRSDLIERGVLTGGFLAPLKPGDFSPRHFTESIDLRVGKTLVLRARRFNLERIGRVTVFPGYYQPGRDYDILYLKGRAGVLLTIKSVEKMKNGRVAIVID